MSSTSKPRTYYISERAKTTRKQPKIAETTQKLCLTIQNNLKYQNWEYLEFSTSVFEPKCPTFCAKKYQPSKLMKFCQCPIWKLIWFQIWQFIFQKLQSQMSKFRHFGPKVLTLFKPNIILHVPDFEDIGLTSETGFQKFWAQILKFGHFGPKSISFLILTKFSPYSTAKVLISNPDFAFKKFEPKFPNLGVLN